jgi:hypothetical protein
MRWGLGDAGVCAANAAQFERGCLCQYFDRQENLLAAMASIDDPSLQMNPKWDNMMFLTFCKNPDAPLSLPKPLPQVIATLFFPGGRDTHLDISGESKFQYARAEEQHTAARLYVISCSGMLKSCGS